jgi:hypothetical protein
MIMNYEKIMAVLQKGLAALPALISAGADVVPLIKRMQAVAGGATVTDAELDALEASIKSDLDEFNSPLPPA